MTNPHDNPPNEIKPNHKRNSSNTKTKEPSMKDLLNENSSTVRSVDSLFLLSRYMSNGRPTNGAAAHEAEIGNSTETLRSQSSVVERLTSVLHQARMKRESRIGDWNTTDSSSDDDEEEDTPDYRSVMSKDDQRLKKLGYKATLPRTLTGLENILTSMETLYFIGGIQSMFIYALATGGTGMTWINWIVVPFMMTLLAASLGEVCSAYPTAASVYYWAYQCGGDKYGPFLSWITAILNVSGWILICASDALGGANFLASEPALFGAASFPTDPAYLQARSVQFALAVAMLVVGALFNTMDHSRLHIVVKIVAVLMGALYFMNLIWLPVAASQSYGLRSPAEVFTDFYALNGANISYDWIVNAVYPMYALIGFDAASHVAEETVDSSTATPKSLYRSVLYSSILAFPIVIAFLFSIPSVEIMLSYKKLPQPIVGMYQLAFGVNMQAISVLLSVIVYLCNTGFALMSTSRLIFALARDRMLPRWIRRVNSHGQPYAAVILTFFLVVMLLIPEIPSAVAYRAIVSSSVMCMTASYGIVVMSRLYFRVDFSHAEWNLGMFSWPVAIISALWCLLMIVGMCFPANVPVKSDNFNYAPAIFFFVLAAAIGSWMSWGRKWYKGPGKKKHVNVTDDEENEEETDAKGAQPGKDGDDTESEEEEQEANELGSKIPSKQRFGTADRQRRPQDLMEEEQLGSNETLAASTTEAQNIQQNQSTVRTMRSALRQMTQDGSRTNSLPRIVTIGPTTILNETSSSTPAMTQSPSRVTSPKSPAL